jgi:anaerobic selenocysteine-containing dehydrogenase
MGCSEPELFEIDEDIIATVLQRSGLGINFPTLATRGTVNATPDPLITFADLKFPTPSGRIEIVSLQAEADGYPRVPLPLADTPPSGARLRLLSPASSWRLNSSFANTGKLDRRRPVPTVRMHPADVASRGLRGGDSVTVSIETGSTDLQVRASDAVLCNVAVAEKGRWPKRQREPVNVNVLNPGRKGDMGKARTSMVWK